MSKCRKNMEIEIGTARDILKNSAIFNIILFSKYCDDIEIEWMYWRKKKYWNGIEEIIFREFSHSDIEIGIDIAKCVIMILKLILVLQNPLREYWNWYWYREMHWGSIEIDIDIAKCFEELLKLLLILQNPLPNIDVFSISKNSVSHIPDAYTCQPQKNSKPYSVP